MDVYVAYKCYDDKHVFDMPGCKYLKLYIE